MQRRQRRAAPWPSTQVLGRPVDGDHGYRLFFGMVTAGCRPDRSSLLRQALVQALQV